VEDHGPVFALKVTAAPCLAERGGDQGGVDVDDDPPGQQFAGHTAGETARTQREQVPHVSADLGADGGDTPQQCVVEQGQGAVNGGVRGRVTEHACLVGQQRDIGHASTAEHDRDRQVDQHDAAVPPARLLPDR
jgi:hypothetical protein